MELTYSWVIQMKTRESGDDMCVLMKWPTSKDVEIKSVPNKVPRGPWQMLVKMFFEIFPSSLVLNKSIRPTTF